jgi:hypothetical protein
MTKSPSTKQVGRPFVRGQVANPKGRPPGLPDRRTRYRDLIEARMPELVERCVELALQGDVQALRLCLERVLPAVRPGDELVELPISGTGSLGSQARAVVGAVFDGRISPMAASTLMSVVAGQANVLEIDELERRIAVLEAAESSKLLGKHS